MGEWLLGLTFFGFAILGGQLMKKVDRFLDQEEEMLRREQEEALEHLRWKKAHLRMAGREEKLGCGKRQDEDVSKEENGCDPEGTSSYFLPFIVRYRLCARRSDRVWSGGLFLMP